MAKNAVYRNSERTEERAKEKERLQQAFIERLNDLIGDSTYMAFAERIGVTPAAVWHYSHGSRFPDVIALANIADCCGVTMDWLVGRENVENSV